MKSPYARREQSTGRPVWILNPPAPARGAREVVCSPVINTSMKSLSSWTAACPGTSTAYAVSCVRTPLGVKPGGPARHGVALSANAAGERLRVDGTRLRDLRDLRLEQRIQDEQGWSVFAFEGMTSQAPATAHMGATPAGGVSGPYPWRRPV
ncbi:hypothetical protein ACTIVE_7298 [Actinomadura verrucosospora]|uniref:Uncharacterized protein n=1 Tax=Actinomadura verrucosospora TaxID=46165 RepID=A0A7D4A116_ACTVE|nr:hypothetical protein ACTIVE_7298 [Actinomadura verrucosospora]